MTGTSTSKLAYGVKSPAQGISYKATSPIATSVLPGSSGTRSGRVTARHTFKPRFRRGARRSPTVTLWFGQRTVLSVYGTPLYQQANSSSHGVVTWHSGLTLTHTWWDGVGLVRAPDLGAASADPTTRICGFISSMSLPSAVNSPNRSRLLLAPRQVSPTDLD